MIKDALLPDALAVLQALDRPAALVEANGAVVSNAPFSALPAAVRARALSPSAGRGWRSQPASGGGRLIWAADGAAEPRLLARERVLATLSHEIRTPLNGVLGMAALLAGSRLDATQTSYLTALRESGEHLLSMVNDVLDFAKLDAERLQLEPVETDLERLLQGVCELLSPRAYDAGTEIAWAVDPRLPRVMADDGRLKQILFNLAGNAVKLTKSGGVLLLAEPRPAPSGRIGVRLSVRDTGPGLSPEAQRRVFEEFVQTEEGARAGGAGLGLAIVARLAEAFGGQVGVESTPGEGATFWFETSFAPAAAVAPRDDLNGVDVSIVSASPIVCEAAARQVAASGGRATTYATLAAAVRQSPAGAVFLIDPSEKGRRRTAPPPAGRAALVLVAPEARGRIARYRAAGYAGYLIKPLRPASIAQRVLAALDRPSQDEPGAAPIAVEDERAAPTGHCGARVLLAEDNAVNALLARALLSHAGCTVDRVASGEEALTALATAPYDIVLMDVRMPVMDGLAATRAMRARGIATPVVALTADAFEEDRRACLEAGMNDFLTKPLESGALRAALARWTAAPGVAKLAS